MYLRDIYAKFCARWFMEYLIEAGRSRATRFETRNYRDLRVRFGGGRSESERGGEGTATLFVRSQAGQTVLGEESNGTLEHRHHV